MIDQRMMETYDASQTTRSYKAVPTFMYADKKLIVLYYDRTGSIVNQQWSWEEKLVAVKQYQFVNGQLVYQTELR